MRIIIRNVADWYKYSHQAGPNQADVLEVNWNDRKYTLYESQWDNWLISDRLGELIVSGIDVSPTLAIRLPKLTVLNLSIRNWSDGYEKLRRLVNASPALVVVNASGMSSGVFSEECDNMDGVLRALANLQALEDVKLTGNKATSYCGDPSLFGKFIQEAKALRNADFDFQSEFEYDDIIAEGLMMNKTLKHLVIRRDIPRGQTWDVTSYRDVLKDNQFTLTGLSFIATGQPMPLDADIDYYLRLNRKGRALVMKNEQPPEFYVRSLSGETDVSVIFFFLIQDPCILKGLKRRRLQSQRPRKAKKTNVQRN